MANPISFQVIEVYFANDKNEYFKLGVSPAGRYSGSINSEERQSALNHVPMHLPIEIHNDCLDKNTDVVKNCSKIWSATTIIEREVLPSNVTKFNAHFTHGNEWGESNPVVESYESLYPQESLIKKPDYHNMAT
jgi:hypothetical protein